MSYRYEEDSMGAVRVPAESLYGAQTARAIANFPVSGQRLPRELIAALGRIKRAAAKVNRDIGYLEPEIADAIMVAAREVRDGRLDAHFPVDVFQTGSGTSSNMNANEVIANRAIQLLGGKLGSRDPVHPNDHVNLGQSSNDVFPSAIHLATVTLLDQQLVPALQQLVASLQNKAAAFDDVVKLGRTHLQEAVPLRLGQELSGFVAQLSYGLSRVAAAREDLLELALGGTAVGTGLNTHPEFGRRIAAELAEQTGLPLQAARNHFEAQAARDALVQCSGTLKTVAVSLLKIANDIRFLATGPRLGPETGPPRCDAGSKRPDTTAPQPGGSTGELRIPAVQPGSSIMPGKVNPVIAESLIQVCAQVIGNDTAVTLGGLYGNFQLNTMQPLIARNVLEQIRLLAASTRLFADRLVAGLDVNRAYIAWSIDRSPVLATALAPAIGYDRAAELAKEAADSGRAIQELAAEKDLLPPAELRRMLDLRRLTEPSLP